MKKSALIIVLLVCFTGLMNAALAQDGKEKLDEFMSETTPEERAQMQTDYMKESLTLSDDQLPRIKEINLKYAQKMQDVYNSTSSKMQKFKQMKSIGQDKDKELKGVLNSTQYATYEKNKEEMKEKIKARIKEKRKEGK